MQRQEPKCRIEVRARGKALEPLVVVSGRVPPVILKRLLDGVEDCALVLALDSRAHSDICGPDRFGWRRIHLDAHAPVGAGKTVAPRFEQPMRGGVLDTRAFGL